MNTQAVVAQIATIATEMNAATKQPGSDHQEAVVAALIARENEAVGQLAAIPASGLSDLLAKIAELGRWRAQSPAEFCLDIPLNSLVDSIIADAARLEPSA